MENFCIRHIKEDTALRHWDLLVFLPIISVIIAFVLISFDMTDREIGSIVSAGGVQQYAFGGFAVPPRSAGLLIIILHALRHVIVNHIADIGLVNAHAKRVCRNDHLHPVIEKLIQ